MALMHQMYRSFNITFNSRRPASKIWRGEKGTVVFAAQTKGDLKRQIDQHLEEKARGEVSA